MESPILKLEVSGVHAKGLRRFERTLDMENLSEEEQALLIGRVVLMFIQDSTGVLRVKIVREDES
jgi:hypothetical protein